MPIDPNRDDRVGVWTPHPELAKGTYQDGDEWYRIRPLSPEISEHIERQSQRPVVNPKTRAVEMERNDAIWKELIWDHLVEDWMLKTTDGDVFPCTLDNKVYLSKHYGQKTNWIVDMAVTYANDDLARKNAEKEAFRGLGSASAGPAVATVQRMSDPA